MDLGLVRLCFTTGMGHVHARKYMRMCACFHRFLFLCGAPRRQKGPRLQGLIKSAAKLRP